MVCLSLLPREEVALQQKSEVARLQRALDTERLLVRVHICVCMCVCLLGSLCEGVVHCVVISAVDGEGSCIKEGYL